MLLQKAHKECPLNICSQVSLPHSELNMELKGPAPQRRGTLRRWEQLPAPSTDTDLKPFVPFREGKVASIQITMWVDLLVNPGAAATQAVFVAGLDLAPIKRVKDAPCFMAALTIHQNLLPTDSPAKAQGTD